MSPQTESPSRQLNVLLDRYLEVCNHYSIQLRKVEEQKDSPDRLTILIQNIEKIELTEGTPIALIRDEEALGQNIVPTQDTLDALAAYRDDILVRLREPAGDVPRNIAHLTRWLRQDVREIVAAFPSFTYAWDKLVELSRLTVVPDGRHLQSRDIVCMATIEFEQFSEQLLRLISPFSPSKAETVSAIVSALDHALLAAVDNEYGKRTDKAKKLLNTRGAHLDQLAESKSLHQIIAFARQDIDLLAIFGLEMGFIHWLNIDNSAAHRKLVIKSLIYFSKNLLAEASWNRAVEFVNFAIALKQEANRRAGLKPDEGTAMFRCNQFWARYKLGHDISADVGSWDTSELHERYTFLKYVLLRRYQEAIKVLENLLAAKSNIEGPNMALAEVEEWPILEDFKNSKLYKDWRAKTE